MDSTIIIIIIAVTLLLLTMVFAAIWVYRDAKQRGLPAGMWVLLVVLSGNFIGLILYLLIGRKQERIICDKCGEATGGGTFCSACGERITVQKNVVKTNKSILVVCVVCIVLAFVAIGIFAYSMATSDGFSYNRQYSSYTASNGQSARKVSQSCSDNIWTLSFSETSAGYSFQQTYRASTQPSSLSVDISCNGSVQIFITQGEITVVEILGEGNYDFDLKDFELGKITIQIINIDASDFSGELIMAAST